MRRTRRSLGESSRGKSLPGRRNCVVRRKQCGVSEDPRKLGPSELRRGWNKTRQDGEVGALRQGLGGHRRMRVATAGFPAL